MAQLVEHILGKDEVPGPNPGSSSRQPQRSSSGALVFYKACATCKAGLSGAATLALGCVLRVKRAESGIAHRAKSLIHRRPQGAVLVFVVEYQAKKFKKIQKNY